MQPIEKRWLTATPITPQARDELSGYHPVLQQILFNRGFPTAQQAQDFLSARIPAGNDPFQLLDMEKAVARILAGIQKKEDIVIYGDYDADGVTSTTLMTQTLQALGATVRAYIPNRFTEGYGLNNDALDELAAQGARLVITVDCGIRAVAEAELANELGLDLIITDHHTPGPEIPPAFAVINPKRPGDPYPDKELAGVGTAFKLASALILKVKPENFSAAQLFDLVAIGTVADLVPLIGENRALVRAGLEKLRQPQRQGILSLLGVAGIRPQQITAMDIGFGIGPRINAAGRLDSAMAAFELLTTTDIFRAGQLAQNLDNQNRERQRITRSMQELAEEIAIQADEIPYLVYAASPEFSSGVVGLTASRLVDQYYRPAIVAEKGETLTKASCRSIPEFHITEALDACSDLLLHHGGHAAAAGFTVANENAEELIARLTEIAKDQLQHVDLRPTLQADMEIKLGSLTFDLLKQLGQLQPTGYGNPDPVFISRRVQVASSKIVGRDKSHLKLTLADGSTHMDAIAFRMGHWQEQMPAFIDVIYHFEKNEFNGRVSLQLNIKDIKPSD